MVKWTAPPVVCALLLTLVSCAPADSRAAGSESPETPGLARVAPLEIEQRAASSSRTSLVGVDDALRQIPTFEEPGNVANYLRALAIVPDAAQAFAGAFRAMLVDGTVEPETKAAMGLQIAHQLKSPYLVVHLRRILAATPRGQELQRHVEESAAVRPAQEVAVRYASWLTADVHGVDDERFGQVRAYYTDPQIVELTLVVSFFNYFTRVVEATRLPIESWALETPVRLPPLAGDRRPARIGMLTDEQIHWAAGVVASRANDGEGGAALNLVNSQRAMNLVPDVTAAWRAYTGAVGREPAVDRELRLHVSFAVSMANGCRYCTLHQVQGLRRLGVDPAKLLQMQKDDTALTPRELAAVVFARKLTAEPSSVTDEDYLELRSVFGERGALDVVLQTANFAFMNRFTDNLGLPSEDEAIQVYREVYGADWE